MKNLIILFFVAVLAASIAAQNTWTQAPETSISSCNNTNMTYYEGQFLGSGYKAVSFCCEDGEFGCGGYCSTGPAPERITRNVAFGAVAQYGSDQCGMIRPGDNVTPYATLCSGETPIACFYTACNDETMSCEKTVAACLSKCPGTSKDCSPRGFYQKCSCVDASGKIHSDASTRFPLMFFIVIMSVMLSLF